MTGKPYILGRSWGQSEASWRGQIGFGCRVLAQIGAGRSDSNWGRSAQVLLQAALVAGIQWEEAGADLIESEELSASVRTKLSRDEQVLLGTELLERHVAADVVVEGTILALLWHEYAPGWYDTFADVIPFSSLVADGLWSTGVDEPPNG